MAASREEVAAAAPRFADRAAALARDGKRRYARWDSALWQSFCDSSVPRLAEGLERQAALPEEVTGLVESYMTLGCEAIGRGLLFPESAGAQSFLTLAFLHLIPERLPALTQSDRAQVLAHCFNLGENLESAPPWLSRIFLRRCRDLTRLDALPELVAEVEREVLEPPAVGIAGGAAVHLVSLQPEDRRMLPGALHFVAPTVVCVHDRLRTAAGGRPAATCGVWLTDPPLPLGPLPCSEEPQASRDGPKRLLVEAVKGDARITTLHASIGNDWRAAATMVTSQMLIVLLPR